MWIYGFALKGTVFLFFMSYLFFVIDLVKILFKLYLSSDCVQDYTVWCDLLERPSWLSMVSLSSLALLGSFKGLSVYSFDNYRLVRLQWDPVPNYVFEKTLSNLYLDVFELFFLLKNPILLYNLVETYSAKSGNFTEVSF